MTNSELTQFLAYWSGPIGEGVWMLMISNVIRNWTDADASKLDSKFALWVHNLNSFQRLIFTALVSISLPLFAGFVLMYVPPEWITAAQPGFALIASVLLVYFAQQGYYQFTKSSSAPGTITAKTTASSSTVTVVPTDPKADAAGR